MNWKNIKDGLPIASETGHWDGKRAKDILVRMSDGSYHVCCMYKGVMDGSPFIFFYDRFDFEVPYEYITHWVEVEHP